MLRLGRESRPTTPAPVTVRIRSIPRRRFSPVLLTDLHALANRLMREEFEHFRTHAETNDVVHVFERADTRAVVGFQFWKTAPIDLPRARAIIGGKLRILPEFRRRGLHLRSGLRFYAVAQLLHPRTRFYRLSLASIFGFTSIASALDEYRLFEPNPHDAETRAITAAFHRLAVGSGYAVDRERGLFFVRIFMTAETLAHYSERFFSKPAARVYSAVNPEYRTNGKYVGFWFRFSQRNLISILRAIRGAQHCAIHHSHSGDQRAVFQPPTRARTFLDALAERFVSPRGPLARSHARPPPSNAPSSRQAPPRA